MDSLIEFLETRAGDYLRTVVEYDADAFEFHYVRDDLGGEGLHERTTVVRDELIGAGEMDDVVEEALGERYASMHLRESCLIINVPVEVDAGLLITLEPEADSQLTTFVKQCANYVENEWPYALG